MLRVRESLARLNRGPDPWSPVSENGSREISSPCRLLDEASGWRAFSYRPMTATSALDIWCGPVSSRAMRPVPADARPIAGSRRIYCRSGILALPLRAAHRVFGVLTLIARSERQSWSEQQIEGGLELAAWLAEARARFEARRQALENSDFSRAVLASCLGDVAVLDATGRLVATNDLWEAAATSLNPVVKGGAASACSTRRRSLPNPGHASRPPSAPCCTISCRSRCWSSRGTTSAAGAGARSACSRWASHPTAPW